MSNHNNLEKEIDLRLSSDLWNEKIARTVISRKRKRFALVAGAISLLVAGFSFLIISVTLRSPVDMELASLIALQINTSYELAGGSDDSLDETIGQMILSK